MADTAREPALGLTTWFYVLNAHDELIAISREQATAILARSGQARPRIPLEWHDDNRGLTLIGIGMVNRMGRPIYVERCSVSFHRLASTRTDARAITIDFELIAARLSHDANELNPDRAGLAHFLMANSQRPLVDDLYLLMQMGRSRLDDIWLDHLLSGRQSSYLWDLRTGSLHPPRTPLQVSHALARRHFARMTKVPIQALASNHAGE